jgi:PAS domain S-box-containing protein
MTSMTWWRARGAARRERSVESDPSARARALRLTAAVAAIVTLLVANASLGLLNQRRVSLAERSVAHDHEVLLELERALSSMTDAETGERGYLITGLEPYLEPFDRAALDVRRHLDRLAELTAGEPEQHARVEALRPLVDAKVADLTATIDVRRASPARGLDAARAMVMTGNGKRTMDAIRERIGTMERIEEAVLVERAQAVDSAVRAAKATELAGLVASVALLGVLVALLRRGLRERERAAAALYAETERLRATLISIGDAVVVTDDGGAVTLMNGVAHRLTGWGPDAIGRPLDEVVRMADETSREPIRPVEHVRRSGEAVSRTDHVVLLPRGGRAIPIEDTASPIRDRAGHMRGVVLVLRDARERRRAEDEQRQHAQELAEGVRRKDEFLAVLSHELRNPLTPIRNGVFLLRKSTSLDERSRRATAVIDRQSAHLQHLLDDLLDLNRITRGKLVLSRARLDLGELVQRTLEDYRSVLEGHELAIELPDEPVWVEGDATRLAQALGNLLENAAKFTPAGGRIRVALSREGGAIALEVADTGIGMDAEMLGRLFEPFSQADRAHERTRLGLGLGLALVKRLVELHGGTARAESAGLGRGSRFVLTLPTCEAPPASSDAGAARASEPGAQLRRRAG